MTCLTSVGIVKDQAERIKELYRALGYTSINAFVQEAVRIHLRKEENHFDAIQEEREVGRKVLGRE